MDIAKFCDQERFILSSCCFGDIEDVVDFGIDSVEWFFIEEHKLIFESMLAIRERKDTIGLVNLSIEARNKGATPELLKKIADLFDYRHTTNLKYYMRLMASAKLFFTLHQEIKIIDGKIVELNFEEAHTTDIMSSIHNISKKLIETNRDKFRLDEKGLISWVNDMLDEEKLARYLPTGISKIDKEIGGGLYPTKLYTIAARPGCGKTALATNFMLNIAREGHRCLYITMELTENEITNRVISTATGVRVEKFYSRQFTDDEFFKISSVTSDFKSKNVPITVNAATRGLWSEVRSAIRSEHKTKNLRVVFVDYVQQFNTQGITQAKTKREDIDFITNDAKQLAIELDIAVVICAQLNRAIESRPDGEPFLSDIKESGGIEQDSDVVFMLYVKNESNNAIDHKNRIILNKIAKNRCGDLRILVMESCLATNTFYKG